MYNIYHRDIVNLLLPCGREGMKACNIARRIYNKYADFFDDGVSYDNIHKSIGVYLWKMCQKRESIFYRNSYGVYSIKPDMAVQLDLFWDYQNESTKDEEDAEDEVEEGIGKDKRNYLQLELF